MMDKYVRMENDVGEFFAFFPKIQYNILFEKVKSFGSENSTLKLQV